METNLTPSEALASHNQQIFPPLELITQPVVPTEQAAFYINRKPQTLRAWACLENGALRPVRINGRLSWKVAEIKASLNGGN